MAVPKMIDNEMLNKVFCNALPPKLGNKGPALNLSILKSLRVMDEQDAINSGRWYNLPRELNQNLIERILYYRYSGMFFYYDKFYFLPYLGQNIDVYGRYVTSSALPFNGSAEGKDEKVKPLLEGKYWKNEYNVVLPDELTSDMFENSCVLLCDYSKQMSQKGLSRQVLQEPLLQVMSEIIPFTRTAMLNGTGIDGIKVNNQDEAYSVMMASNALTNASLNGDRWIPIEGSVTLEPISHTQTMKCEEYMEILQSLDNYRLSLHGIDNGGLFQKKAHVLQSESNMNAGTAGLVMADKTYQRQEFCNIVNSIWGLGIWYEPSEEALEADMDMDGKVSEDQENIQAEQEQEIMEGEE